MSSALSGSRASIWARMASLHGSAPKIPTRSEISSRATPASPSASPSRAAYEGGQRRTAGCRSGSVGGCAGHRDRGAAHQLGPGVNAPPTSKEPVAVAVVDDAPRPGAGAAEGAGAHLGPELEGGAGVGDQGGPPAGARGAVDAQDLLAGDGQQAPGVGVPQILLGGERQGGQGGRG